MKVNKSRLLNILLSIVIFLPYIGLGTVFLWSKTKVIKIENSNFIVVSKQDKTLSLYDYKGKEKLKFPVAIGLNSGDKNTQGDMRTPEGVFKVIEIQKSDHWVHDFNDGLGEVIGAYGPYFIRLHTSGHSGIGIHGTHDNSSLGKRATEGCIRLQNENILNLVKYIHPGTVVIITPSIEDIQTNNDL